MTSLAQALGHNNDDRLLILSADLMGSTHAATAAGLSALRDGCATTATLMMTGPWARHAADHLANADDLDVGIHLTLNAELESFRWAPLTHAPSLSTATAGSPAPRRISGTTPTSTRSARMPSPGRAGDQLGVEPTHLTTHLLAMQQRPEFFDVLLDIAVEVELPIRLESGDAETTAGFPFRRLATEEGVSIPDHFRLVRGGTRAHLEAVLADLAPGVTEVAFAPALAAEEIEQSTRPQQAASTTSPS